MTIKQKSLLIISLSLILVIVTLYAVSYSILVNSYQDIENDFTRAAMNRVKETIETTTKYLKNTSADWGYWDDTYFYALGVNENYPEDNLTLESLSNINLSLIAIFDRNNQLVGYRTLDPLSGEDIDLLLPVNNLPSEEPGLFSREDILEKKSGISDLPEDPMIIVGSSILRSNQTGIPAGTIVIGRFLDDEMISGIAQQTNTKIDTFSLGNARNYDEFNEIFSKFKTGEEIPVKIIDSSTISAYSYLYDSDGEPSHILKISLPRTIYQQGVNTLRFLLFVLISFAIIATIATYLLIDKILLSRVSVLTEELAKIMRIRKSSARLGGDAGTDEISTLSQSINNLLDTMEEIQMNYKILVENQEEGLVIVDEDENVLYANPAADNIFGVIAGGLTGKNVNSYLNTSDQALVKTETAKRKLGEKGSYEVTIHPETGVDKVVHISAVPRYDENQNFTAAYVVIRDITQVKKAQEELEASERKFRSIVEQSRLGIFLLDGSGRIIEWNNTLEKVTGLQKTEVFNQKFLDVSARVSVSQTDSVDYREKMLQLFHSFRENNLSEYFYKAIEITYRQPNGKVIITELSLFPIHSEGRMQIGGIVDNITEKKQIEQNERDQRVFLEALRDTSEALNSDLDFESLLERILINAERVIHSDTGAILMMEKGLLRVVRTRGYADRGLKDLTHHEPFSIEKMQNMAWMADTGLPIAISDTSKYSAWNPLPENEWVKSYIGMPLRVRQRTIGFLSLFSATPGYYTEEHAQRLKAFASQTATAIENARLYAEVQQKADTDELTGLRNRRSLFELGAREVERAIRFNHPLSILMIDLDYFKQVNDHFGHPVGDRLLTALADQFRSNLRNVDLIARYGGDEFVILLPENSSEQAIEIAHRIQKAIRNTYIETAQGKASVDASIGIAELNSRITTLAELIEIADRALYSAKQEGRSRVVASPQ